MLQTIKYLTLSPKRLIPVVLKRSYCKATKTSSKEGQTGSSTACQTIIGDLGGRGADSKGETGKIVLKRAIEGGKCRMGFIPEEWFQFLKPMTGVTGPYFLMIGLTNYLVSKEIYVMEHEYYLGISVFIVIYYMTTRYGRKLGEVLDKEVDAVVRDIEKDRIDDLAAINKQIKEIEKATWRAEGQKDLMNAKKENIKVQLEAVFRERQMLVYNAVRKRLDYHVKRDWITRRLKQKWMAQWVTQNVEKGITPEFKRKVLDIAIKDFAALADRAAASFKK